FARPRTIAAQMRDIVPFSEIKARSAFMSRLALDMALERNREWVGWEGEILVDESGTVSGSWIGRNFAYKPIVIKRDGGMLGNFVRVKAVEAFPTHLEGEIID
ncbi:MAG: TRAM domain-containing protein, partial [Candidatus Bathyarchaeia archaeon]